jgi:polyhydroxyalkanoate synthase
MTDQKAGADAIAQQAADNLNAAEDIGEFDVAEVLGSLLKVVDAGAVGKECVRMAGESLKILAGRSELTPEKGDNRFKDVAWQENPAYKRLGQGYLAFSRAMDNILSSRGSWRNQERAKFTVDILTSAVAPTNFFWTNPAAIKEAFDTGGKSVLRGWRNRLHDLRYNGGMPTMVDATPFVKGDNVAATPGAVVFRNEVLELLQYTPTTARVCALPMLIVPPQINKYYFLDLAPQRSLVEYATANGIRLFMVSWRNPGPEQRDWDLDTYVSALLEAADAMLSITRQRRFNALGFCAGGITLSCLAAYMAANDDRRLNSIGYAVTLLDWNTRAMIGMLHSRKLIDMAKKASFEKGVISGKDLGVVFTWFRPNDLVWSYWVNNYLLGRNPPSFDILAWNDDSTNLPAALHGQFLDIFLNNDLTHPGKVKILNTPIDLRDITVDAFVTGALNDHLTPWTGCYKTTQLLGSENIEYILSHAGHIASLVNPPGNPKASYYVGGRPGPDPDAWRENAKRRSGSWWETWVDWTRDRSGEERAAPKSLGNKKYPALDPAPGKYINT